MQMFPFSLYGQGPCAGAFLALGACDTGGATYAELCGPEKGQNVRWGNKNDCVPFGLPEWRGFSCDRLSDSYRSSQATLRNDGLGWLFAFDASVRP
ncbi:MAG: hypothetical protein LDL37_16190 [Asticcacaulis sp.]|jgi:hypothetical protein|uniref:hypothetical protein n=1 Tax=Asticcacaulis sp. TaxID=1872648 RepID=UPI0025C107D4|nr:hypothetical protein [Asticcacaulis sp.]MCA1936985.1 hypothetical protein [Asticcacaulis sp.]